MSKPIPLLTDNDVKRFWAKVDIQDSRNCWEWKSTKNSRGGYGFFNYGNLKDGNKQYLLAHRVSYFLSTGEDPKGFFVCHSCDNPMCVNPAHLWLGTAKDNSSDMVSKGRASKGFHLKEDKNRPKGSKNSQAKLTEKDIPTIFEMFYVQKISQRQIGLMYGINGSVVNAILTRKTWEHVEIKDYKTKEVELIKIALANDLPHPLTEDLKRARGKKYGELFERVYADIFSLLKDFVLTDLRADQLNVSGVAIVAVKFNLSLKCSFLFLERLELLTVGTYDRLRRSGAFDSKNKKGSSVADLLNVARNTLLCERIQSKAERTNGGKKCA